MAHSYRRKDIVGKRFLCVGPRDDDDDGAAAADANGAPLTSPGAASLAPPDWKWRAGVVRASTHHNVHFADLQVLNNTNVNQVNLCSRHL